MQTAPTALPATAGRPQAEASSPLAASTTAQVAGPSRQAAPTMESTSSTLSQAGRAGIM